MLEVKGNIWDYYEDGYWIVIPVNMFVKNDGTVVMGRGLAKQAGDRFNGLAKELGGIISDEVEPTICLFPVDRLITFPVKYNWWERANLGLIEKSCQQLELASRNEIEPLPIYLPRVGCGNGRLKWEDVKPILDKWFSDDFIVCDWSGE